MQHIVMHIPLLSFRILIIIEKHHAPLRFQNKATMIYIGKFHKDKGNANIPNRE